MNYIKFLCIITVNAAVINIGNSSSITLELSKNPYKYKYGTNKISIKPYKCSYEYYNDDEYKIINKSSENFKNFINDVSTLSEENFTIYDGIEVVPLQKELLNIGLPVAASNKKIKFEGVEISNDIKHIFINGGTISKPMVELEINKNCFNNLTNINFHLSYIPFLSINVSDDYYEYSEESEEEEDEDDKNYNKIITHNMNNNVLSIGGIDSKKYTVLQSNLPISINNRIFVEKPKKRDLFKKCNNPCCKEYIPPQIQYIKKLVVKGNKITPFNDVYWC